ncbi:MAG: autoinducer 2 ABC transporter substrate-binding protein [Spirochaetia bacterium]|nr:autoinducer 2 ABC transporter substrate-binding protein [Spirochaetia bacterium]
MKKVGKLLLIGLVLLMVAQGVFAAGAQETAAPADGKYTMVAIPKLRAAWFNALESGMLDAAKEYGIDAYMQAPAAADEAQQVRLIEDAINQGVDSIMVVPNDANSVVPAFQRARQQGIVIMTHESPNQEAGDYNVEMIDNVKFGETMIKEIAARTDNKGKYVVFVGSLTVPAHNIWADAAIAYQKANYPQMTLVTTKQPVSEDRNAARQKTLELLSVHPDLKAVLAFGSQGAPGAAQALRERNLVGKLAVIGTTSPKEIAPFLKDGSASLSVLWNPGEAGYAMVWLSKLILDGNRDQIKQGLDIPTLGVPEITGMNILFDRPLIVDADNVDNYDF